MQEGVIEYRQYISLDPDILGGKPCIAGTRISVELILEQLALGDTVPELLDQYPHITEEQIHAALAFASTRIHDDYAQEHVA
ncbi:MAG TPA: DUF433 domain-containing protein [Ktedonobacteraceae bacterium]|jgi:uncharacterized protein (DUF433 family)